MPTYYMRVDAVNLAQSVYDTYDISTIRGGSFLLLQAIARIPDQFKLTGRLRPISTAASQGLFAFQCAEEDQAYRERLRRDVLAYLDEKTGGHATFLLAMEKEDPSDFRKVLEKLEAQIHRQQWRMPTVAIPAYERAAQECYLDGWRPGVEVDRRDDEENKISRATSFRRDHGRKLRNGLFYELLKDKAYEGLRCTGDLEQLTKDRSKGVLDGKMAFIYADGNSFGSIRRLLCKTEGQRGQFDEAIQSGVREPFLRALLQRARQDPAFKTKDEEGREALRLEILLWGGDEMMLVVPAWRGWQALQLFYEQAKNLEFQGMPLSHRAAMIFCHHDAPILQIRELADRLLARTKEDAQTNLKDVLARGPAWAPPTETERAGLVARLSNHAYGDAFHYLALESFDMLGGSLGRFLDTYYGKISPARLLVRAEEMEAIRQQALIVRGLVARSKVLQAIQAIHDGHPEHLEGIKKQIIKLAPPGRRGELKTAIEGLTGADPARGYILGDLWDYIPEWAA